MLLTAHFLAATNRIYFTHIHTYTHTNTHTHTHTHTHTLVQRKDHSLSTNTSPFTLPLKLRKDEFLIPCKLVLDDVTKTTLENELDQDHTKYVFLKLFYAS